MSSDRRSPWIAAAALCGALWAASVQADPAQDPVPDFDGERAMHWLVRQCELGPRPPGSDAHRELQEMIVARAAANGLTARRQCFEVRDPLSGEVLRACNIIVSTSGDGPRLWLGAHYDTRPVSDHDPDPARRSEPLLGANDGASGTAVLLHLMEILGETPPPSGVDLLFFDAEDSGRAGSPHEFCLGSRRLAESLGEFSSPLRDDPRGLIVLDMVGERGLRVPQEGYSLRFAPAWTETVFRRAGRLGLPAFLPEPGPAVYDDHVPFLNAGVAAVDLIDFDFPEWHTTADTPAICAPESLEQVGRLVVDLIYRP